MREAWTEGEEADDNAFRCNLCVCVCVRVCRAKRLQLVQVCVGECDRGLEAWTGEGGRQERARL